MIEKEKFDELQKKQDDLRLERNKLADEQQKIQKQIDEIAEAKVTDVPDDTNVLSPQEYIDKYKNFK